MFKNISNFDPCEHVLDGDCRTTLAEKFMRSRKMSFGEEADASEFIRMVEMAIKDLARFIAIFFFDFVNKSVEWTIENSYHCSRYW